jgi:hypothetical protein
MRTDGLTKTFLADGVVTKYRIITAGTNSGDVAIAADATAPLFGISTEVDVADNEHCDVFLPGSIADCYAGGNVTFGTLVTSDDAGAAVAATPAADTNSYYVGIAMATGVDGDIIPVLICPGIQQGEPA